MVTIETITKDLWVKSRKEEVITYLGVKSEHSVRAKSDKNLNNMSGKPGFDRKQMCSR
jgi:hypothetical protein